MRKNKTNYNSILVISSNQDAEKRSKIVDDMRKKNTRTVFTHSIINGFEPVFMDYRGFSIDCVILTRDNERIEEIYKNKNIPVIKI